MQVSEAELSEPGVMERLHESIADPGQAAGTGMPGERACEHGLVHNRVCVPLG